jgi:flavin-dependent dehydrogenase
VNDINGNLHDGFILTVRTTDGLRKFQTKAVIAAYGKHSGLDRRFQRRYLNRYTSYVALKRHFTGPPLPHRIDLHVFRGGYCGMSHVENNVTNVCLLVRQQVFRETMRDKPDDVKPFIDWMRQQNSYLDEWLRQATPLDDKWLSIAQIPLVTKAPIEDDLLFTGDAAGIVAPLAGDGMAMALHSGKMAAHSLDAYLTHQLSAEAMKQLYARTWHRTFRRRLQLGRGLQSIMLRPKILGIGLQVINLLPAIGDFLVAQTRDLGLLEQKP